MIKDKYSLTRKQSEFLAKKMITDTIYCGIKMEGSKMTFPETQTIMDGVNVPNATLDDIQAILNMRDAWKYVLGSLDEPFTLDYACKVNSFVARAEHVPTIPQREEVEQHIIELQRLGLSTTEKALRYFVWGAKSQLFWDGNKRTSLICANKLLLQEGKGLLSIKDSDIPEFNNLLTGYYKETGGNSRQEKLINFLYDNSIRGITFQNEMKEELIQDVKD